MNRAKFGILALLAGTAALASCTSDQTASALAHGSGVAATAPMSTSVDNFMLVDANMEAHELYRLADAPAIVIVTQANGDAVMRAQAPALKALKAAYAAKGVEFMMLNSNLKDTREAIQAEAQKAGYDTPILMDSYQLVGESLGVTRSAEVIVVDPKTWKVAYHGALMPDLGQGAGRPGGRPARRDGRRPAQQPARRSPSLSAGRPRSPTPRTWPRSWKPSAWPATRKAASARSP